MFEQEFSIPNTISLLIYSDIIRTGKFGTTETLRSPLGMMWMLQISIYQVIIQHLILVLYKCWMF